MPRKTKEQKELENKIKMEKPVKKSTTQKARTTASKSTSTAKKNPIAKKKTSTAKIVASSKKSATKTTSATKGKTTLTKKKASKSTVKKKSTKAKTLTKKTVTKKFVSKKTMLSRKKVEIVEYYDLPYRYNQTIVKVLAQSPTNLFIYWDISDNDRKNFKKQYGDSFFETTRPILLVHNDTLGYSFEVEINDFANSWYLHVADSKCNYRIELGRRPIVKTEKLNTDYFYITTSNKIESPNDRVLFDKKQKMVYFRNVKTGQQSKKQISSISFIRNMGKIYNIYDLYKAMYKDENIEEIYGNPSSGSFSSKFK